MEYCWFPYDLETGDLFLFTAAREEVKRRREPNGMYLDSLESTYGVPMVNWKIIVDFASIYSCKVWVEHSKSVQSESRQDATGTSTVVVVQSPAVTNAVELGELTENGERVKQRVADMEWEKKMLVAERSILASSNTNDELAALDLQAEAAGF